eukprot:GSMAST32.ASY1.ANO1.2402.1 assembled CDS
MDEIVALVKDKVVQGGYKLNKSIVVDFSLPPSILVREFSIWLQLAKTHGSSVCGAPPSSSSYSSLRCLKLAIRNRLNPLLASALGVPVRVALRKPADNKKDVPVGQFNIHILFDHSKSQAECVTINPKKSDNNQKRSRKRRRIETTPKDTIASVVKNLRNFGIMVVQKGIDAVIAMPGFNSSLVVVDEAPSYDIVLSRSPIYLMGRYMKYARGVSQSPWFIDNKRMADTSVHELIAIAPLNHFGVDKDSCKFHTAGREDVDVRMLGRGRPFVLEILNAKHASCTPSDCVKLTDEINAYHKKYNGAVQVRDFSGAESKRKTYSAVCWISRDISQEELNSKLATRKDVSVKQLTPIRVMHRRTVMVRDKIVYNIQCKFINKRWFVLELETSAGMYVKEFVHGDLGRTTPNVASILGNDCKCDIIQLDVMEVLM